MKKYKLVKEYPGSDHEGIIVSLKTPNGLYEGYQYNYSTKHVENNPEYWEEVVEKDYEIISYVAKDNPINITTKRRGAHLHEDYWKIHSVKRLSDGEIFTVGDLIKTPYTEGTRITKFQNPEGNEYFIEIPTGFARLSTIEKVKKQPIFLTHNGKDIFVGDRIVWVNKDSLVHGTFTADYGSLFLSDQVAYFLSAVDAQDYIQKNQVLFTTEDGVSIKHGDKYYFVDTDLKITLAPNASTGAGLYDEREYFSTYETAQYYVIVNAKVLSIEDFWEFVSKPGSNVVKQKALKRLVKERLNLK